MSIENGHSDYVPMAEGEALGVAPEELSLLQDKAQQLWDWARIVKGKDIFPGFETTATSERLEVQKNYSSTQNNYRSTSAQYDKLSVFRSEQGVLCIEEEVQRSTLEIDESGPTVRTTTTWPLVSGECPTIIETRGYLLEDGALGHPQYDQAFGDPMTSKIAEKLSRTLDIIGGNMQPQPKRGRGWLRSLLTK